jgi:5-methylcytosine-specific restriction protein A
MRRDGGRCYSPHPDVCTGKATTVDHKIPRSAGGSDRDDNLAAICPPCHHVKTAAEAAAAHRGGGCL